MKMKDERWKSIVGFEGFYEVSDWGNVRSLNYLGKTGKVKLLKPGITRGYYHVNLRKNGKIKGYYVHRLVVTAFRGVIPRGLVVNHRNENKLDNRLENLEVITQKENINHGTCNERIAKANSKELKLTNARTSAKYTFSSSREASEFFGYRKSMVKSLICSARQRGEKFIKIKGEKHYFTQLG